MKTITTQQYHDLDSKNRFFEDNLKVAQAHGDKQLLEKNAKKSIVAKA